jgi:hypothetical protein
VPWYEIAAGEALLNAKVKMMVIPHRETDGNFAEGLK